MATMTPARASAPRTAALDRDVAIRLAGEAYARLVDVLRELSPQEWSAPTACPAWDVRAMAGHVLGMAEMWASPLEAVRQLRAAKRAGGLVIDALTDLQVRKHRHRTPEQVVAMLAHVAPRSVRGRSRIPAVLRRRAMADQPVDDTGTQTEAWSVGYLVDVVLTRDTWMHRSDVAAAVGRPMRLTADHDGVLVADIAAEWATRHGQPCTLVLSGPAGGSWTWGGGGPAVELDAVEFCRIVSGRGHGDGLLATRVPF